jgi:hypothetical protein
LSDLVAADVVGALQSTGILFDGELIRSGGWGGAGPANTQVHFFRNLLLAFADVAAGLAQNGLAFFFGEGVELGQVGGGQGGALRGRVLCGRNQA